jgi:hypothetical protein
MSLGCSPKPAENSIRTMEWTILNKCPEYDKHLHAISVLLTDLNYCSATHQKLITHSSKEDLAKPVDRGER